MHRFGLKTVFSKLFASVMLTLVLFAIAMIALTHLVHDNSADTRWMILAKQIVNQVDPFVDELDNATTSNERLQARFMLAVIKKSLDIFDESLQAKMGVYDRAGNLLIQTDDSDLPKMLPDDPSWISRMLPPLYSASRNSVQVVGDRGYTLLYEPRNPPKRSELSAVLNLFTGTLLLLGIMTLVLWWIARSMTWRLNQMSRQMTQLGEGNFSVRVPARGTDEIASLAHGFNQAAQKIEQLINANSLLLAHASHEFRTPITRIRLQIEMMEMLSEALNEDNKAKFYKRSNAIKQDLTGLNELVESILLVSRLDAGHAAEKYERVNLYTLVNLESQHFPEATFVGKPITIEGQPKLLIHLVRNLLNNAMIHGVPPIEIQLYGVMNVVDAATSPESLQPLNHASAEVTDNTEQKEASKADPLRDAIDRPLEKIANMTEDTIAKQSMVSAYELQAKDTQQEASMTDTVAENGTSIETGIKEGTETAAKIGTENNQSTPVATIDSLTSALTEYGNDTSVFKAIDPQINRLSPKRHQPLVKRISKRIEGLDPSYNANNTGHKSKPVPQDKRVKSQDSVFAKRLRRPKFEKTQPEIIPNFAVLAIIDKGTGIPFDKRQEIFSPFVRLQQKKKGSGLGLSLVAQIVEAHHGRISTDVYQGQTRFLVILPTSVKHAINDYHT